MTKQFTKEENRNGIRNLLILLPGVVYVMYLVYAWPITAATGINQPISIAGLAIIGLLLVAYYFFVIRRMMRKT